MKSIVHVLLIGLVALPFLACEREAAFGGGSWLIPQNEVFDGGPGKDGIPSIDNPSFVSREEGDAFVADSELVVGVVNNGVARAYPHSILNWHEIINDQVGNISVAVTYCPLTGTAIGWDRMVDTSETTFGVSGLLYNTNLLPYDRASNSIWSQMRLDCVNGSLAGTKVGLHQVVETTWGTWKSMYPQTEVVSDQTGFFRDYTDYPYGDYITNDSRLFFPISHADSRLPAKDRVLGVTIGEFAKVYPIASFGAGVKVIADEVNGTPLVAVGSESLNFAVAFEGKAADGTLLSFTALQDQLPLVMSDNEGNQWDVFGRATSGPRSGEQLKAVDGYIGYFFAWGTFYPGMEIYEN